MDAAVEADKLAIEEQRPAIEKLKMLNEVIAVLQKCDTHSTIRTRTKQQVAELYLHLRPHLETTILEADILTQIRRWLEPIGKNLPAVNIQRELLAALVKVSRRQSSHRRSRVLTSFGFGV